MKPRKPLFQSDRRRFFRRAFFLGATGVAAVCGRSIARPVRLNQTPARAPARGYRLTAHVRKYYERASF